MLLEKLKKYINEYTKICIFLDYDGTLTKIQKLPKLAVLEKDMRDILKNLKQKYFVGIISGRQLNDVKKLVDIEGIFYAGNHGLEIIGENIDFVHDAAEKTAFILDELDEIISKKIKGTGAFLEHKGLSLSLHYRNVEASKEQEIKDIFYEVFELLNSQTLKFFEGKKVIEIRPNIDWNKGKAIEKIVRLIDADAVIFIGDDTTDEDGFKVVNNLGGFSIRVGKKQDSYAQYFLQNTEKVKKLLKMLL